MGARQTLAPPIADTSHTKPDSQSASRRHNSPNLRPYANKQLPVTENIDRVLRFSKMISDYVVLSILERVLQLVILIL